MNYKTQGIILKRRNIGETDRILTVLTNRYGKISIIAKGIRKTLSKLGGHLELFYLTDFVIAEGKNLDIVTGAQIIKPFSNLRKDLRLTQKVYYLSELIDKLVNENVESKEIFDLFYNALEELDRSDNPLLLRYFELQILSHLGHKPEVDVCVKCRNKLTPEKIYWSNELGGTLCENCRQYSEGFLQVSAEAIKIFRIFLEYDISAIHKLKLDKKLMVELENIIDNFLSYSSEKDFNSKKYVREK